MSSGPASKLTKSLLTKKVVFFTTCIRWIIKNAKIPNDFNRDFCISYEPPDILWLSLQEEPRGCHKSLPLESSLDPTCRDGRERPQENRNLLVPPVKSSVEISVCQCAALARILS